ncbi:predicted protein [Lichtheimia corymbifera JMRC:FSU:9682]|uniref:Uncharacterized protein n=1 Tax=Lichtheimia corymbifera JMRC:FSU:9682 TaxID=1263082 RepID=A0A068S009_9FUNG|nr:predicted protein [Lichtheimia corymbifera JMRC:FSU:9682]
MYMKTCCCWLLEIENQGCGVVEPKRRTKRAKVFVIQSWRLYIQADTSMEPVRLQHWALNVPVDTKHRAGIAMNKRQQRCNDIAMTTTLIPQYLDALEYVCSELH